MQLSHDWPGQAKSPDPGLTCKGKAKYVCNYGLGSHSNLAKKGMHTMTTFPCVHFPWSQAHACIYRALDVS